jgi:FRG domain
MRTMEINSIKDFYDFLHDYTESENNQIYRGMRNSTWGLVPSVGRVKTNKGQNYTVEDEKLLLRIFKHRAYPFIKDFLDSDIELLTIGQHHGLPTRVLDWTKNPLAGIYFAVEEPFTKEDEAQTEHAALYIYEPTTKAKLDNPLEPFSVTEVERYIPKHWDKRIISQAGLFTVHHQPYTPWRPTELKVIKIHKSVRKDIKKSLNRFGINPGTIYPDLDGVTKHIKWLRSDEH